MKKHSDCEDRCQITEHKGYVACEHGSGCCELLSDGKTDDCDVARDALIVQDETRNADEN